MMKQLGLIFCLSMLFCPSFVFGQSDSLNLETKTIQNRYSVTAVVQTDAAYSIGATTYIPLNKRWSFEPGLFWEYRDECNSSGMGSKSYDVSGELIYDNHEFWEFKDKAHFITAPLLFRKRMSKLKRKNFVSYFHIGAYLAYGITGTSKCRYDFSMQNKHYEREMDEFRRHPEWYDFCEPQKHITIDETTSCDAFGAEGAYVSRFDYGIDIGFSFLISKRFEVGTFMELSVSGSGRERGQVCCSHVKNRHGGIGLSLGYQF